MKGFSLRRPRAQEKGEGCELAKRDKLRVTDEWSNRAAVFGQWCFNYGIHESSMTWLQSYIYIYVPIGITKERDRERGGGRHAEEDVENEKKIRIQSGVLEIWGRKERKASPLLEGKVENTKERRRN